jgi:hypothetical protein
MVCQTCTKDFEAKRKTAKFCSPNCRVKHGRGTLGKVTGIVVDEVKQAEELLIPVLPAKDKTSQTELDPLSMAELVRFPEGYCQHGFNTKVSKCKFGCKK